MMKRSPFRDSRNQKILGDPKQSTDLKVFNFPMTEILAYCRENPSCNITVDTDKDSWVVKYEIVPHSNRARIIIKGKEFLFDTSHGTIKLSGPGSDSLNLMLTYILKLLNKSVDGSGPSDGKIKQRCKTINKKIGDYLGDYDHSEVPLPLLEQIYENSINSVRIDQSNIMKSPRKSAPKGRTTTTYTEPLINEQYRYNDDLFTLSIPDAYALAPSKYIKNEYGIFTKREIKANETIGVYKGIVCFMETKKKSYDDLFRSCYSKYCKQGSYLLKNDRYDICVKKNKVIDASIQNQGSFVRYINSGFPNHFYNNCVYDNSDDGTILLRATRAIHVGEELLCDYGINSESNILDNTVTVNVVSINQDDVVTFSRLYNKEEEVNTMKFRDFRNKYYHILRDYLKKNNKQGMYKALMKDTLVEQKDRYTLAELDAFKDTELDLFLTNIQIKLDSEPSNMSDLKRKHYSELRQYYENKIKEYK